MKVNGLLSLNVIRNLNVYLALHGSSGCRLHFLLSRYFRLRYFRFMRAQAVDMRITDVAKTAPLFPSSRQ